MRILLADDHAILRSGLRRIIEDAFPSVVIGEAGTCQELRAKVREADWTLLILDIALGDRNSLDVVPELKQLRPNMSIIVLSMYEERQFVIRALRSGVSAYLTKERAPEELLQAIRAVQRGERYIGETVALRLAEYMALAGSGSEPLHEKLSEREYEVFRLLASAVTLSEIAARMNLSVKTISTYRSRILEKMGMQTNADLMRYALQHKLVT